MLYRCCYILLLFCCETQHIDSCWFFISCCWIHCNRVVPDKNIPFLNRCFCIFFFLNFCIFWFYIQLFTVHFFWIFVSSMYKYLQVFFFFWILLFTLFFLCTTLFVFFSIYNFIHFVYLQFIYLQLCQAAGAIKRIPGI